VQIYCTFLHFVNQHFAGLPASGTHCIKKNTKTLIDANKDVGLEINVDKTKYMLLSHHQNVGQNRDINIANKSFENIQIFGDNSNKSKFDSGGN
jgi:hypothetical protein